MHVQVVRDSRLIVARGTFTAEHPDPAIEIVDVADEQDAAFWEPGDKYLLPDGTVEVRLSDAQRATIEADAAAHAQRAAGITLLGSN